MSKRLLSFLLFSTVREGEWVESWKVRRSSSYSSTNLTHTHTHPQPCRHTHTSIKLSISRVFQLHYYVTTDIISCVYTCVCTLTPVNAIYAAYITTHSRSVGDTVNECVSCGAVRTGLSGFGKNQRGRSDFRERLVWFWLKRERRQEHQARTGITVKCRPHGTGFFPSFCLCQYHTASHQSSCSFSCKALVPVWPTLWKV